MRALLRTAAPRNGGLQLQHLRSPLARAATALSLSAATTTTPAGAVTVAAAAPSAACPARAASSKSNSQWKQRQARDFYAREAKVQGLKSRAAFKLLEMDAKYRLFRRGQTVVDLGYAPGSWSQVAQERTKPHGRVVGIDIIPAQPPRGVSTIQGNFLSPQVQGLVKEYLQEFASARPAGKHSGQAGPLETPSGEADRVDEEGTTVVHEQPSYIDAGRARTAEADPALAGAEPGPENEKEGRLVDVVLSDMSAPWSQTSGFGSNTLSNPYLRMMNTSGMSFRDHAGSMDLCAAALQFASDTLRSGGHFVCKFYQGSEDKQLEKRLKKMFAKVHREKPDSSRTESKEAYFVALRRKGDVTLDDIDE